MLAISGGIWGYLGSFASSAANCIDDKDTQSRTMRIAQDGATRFGVNGTPTFIVDGQKAYVGEWDWSDLKAALDAKLPK